MSGLIADAKTLIDKARVETQVRADVSQNSSFSAGGRLWCGMMVGAEELVGVGGLCAAWLPAHSSCRTDAAASAFFLFYTEHLVGILCHVSPHSFSGYHKCEDGVLCLCLLPWYPKAQMSPAVLGDPSSTSQLALHRGLSVELPSRG